MRIGLLTSLALGAAFSSMAQASSDDTCYPHWSMLKYSLDGCSNLAFLSPGNDSRVNLRLMLADQGILPFAPRPLSNDDLGAGYGPVPFAGARLVLNNPLDITDQAPAADASPLGGLLEKLGLHAESQDAPGENFLSGEGGRCRSNSNASATAFIQQLINTPELSNTERQSLARSRLRLLGACSWEPAQQDALLPTDLQSAQGKAFASYLHGAIDFYSGRFAEAGTAFASLSDTTQPWLKETAQYMQARTALNLAQQNTFDADGMPTTGEADATQLKLARDGFDSYLKTYAQGLYANSARGLLRRVYWLGGEHDKQAAEYLWQLSPPKADQRTLSPDDLVQEIDNKLLMGSGTLNQPLFQAVDDLMGMRPAEGTSSQRLTLAALQAQKPVFEATPALYDYLLAAFHLYVEKNPELALKSLPSEIPAKLDYLALSQQLLRGLALEAKQDWSGAEALWVQLLPVVQQPLQREQVELALANNYERSQRTAKVFAADSPIKTPQVRAILLRHIADATLLRQQITQGTDATERDTALFVLLYKDLRLGHYADFSEDLKQLPAQPSDKILGSNLGYTYGAGQSLKLFQWTGAKAESGYACPAIGETAATLQADEKSPQALNCLGEFILRNSLDGMPLDSQGSQDELGGTASLFKGVTYSRLDGYQSVIANAKASHTDKAYALFRTINCYAPAGYNSCGGKEINPAQRKALFKQLKSGFADTQWGKSLQYYW